MRYKATFAAGFSAGYLLGARAGRERYEQIMRTLRDFADKPTVQETAGVMQAQAGELASSAKRVVDEKVTHRGSPAASVPPYPASAGAGG